MQVLHWLNVQLKVQLDRPVVTPKHLVEGGVAMADHLIARVILEQYAISVRRRLILLVEIAVYLKLFSLVSWLEVNVEFLIVRVLLQLSHRLVELVKALPQLDDAVYFGY